MGPWFLSAGLFLSAQQPVETIAFGRQPASDDELLGLFEAEGASELAARRAARRAVPPTEAASTVEVRVSSVERLIDRVFRTPDEERVSCFFKLRDDFFDPRRQSLPVGREDRNAIRGLIEAENTIGLMLAVSALTALDAEILQVDALGNQIVALVPAKRVVDALGIERVVNAGLLDGTLRQSGTYDGKDARDGTRAAVFLSDGYDANVGNRVDEDLPIVIAVLEAEGTPTNRIHDHVGFDDTNGGSSRILAKRVCVSNSCSNDGFAAISDAQTHGDAAASIALGSIEQAQDPDYPGSGTTDQKRRSGISKEAALAYFRVTDTQSVDDALYEAWDLEADVANLSFEIQGAGADCNPGADLFNAAIDIVSALGMLVVASAGNDGHSGGCTVDYPALRPNVLSVGGLHTSQTASGVPAYGATTLMAISGFDTAKGGLPIVVDGVSRTTSAIGVLAPGIRALTFNGVESYATFTRFGTSFATPVVAGLATLWKDNVYSNSSQPGGSTLLHDTRAQRAALYVTSDAFSGVGTSGTSFNRTTDLSGYGRSRIYETHDDHFGDPGDYSWFIQKRTFSSEGTITLNINDLPDSATQISIAFFWDEFDELDDCADIEIELWRTNPSSFLRRDNTFNLTKRIMYFEVGGFDLQIRYLVNHLPSSRIGYTAYVWHSGTAQ
jgi:hypothetical protein